MIELNEFVSDETYSLSHSLTPLQDTSNEWHVDMQYQVL
jgi:hypothetical protein